jgi:hypothetical protein
VERSIEAELEAQMNGEQFHRRHRAVDEALGQLISGGLRCGVAGNVRRGVISGGCHLATMPSDAREVRKVPQTDV